MAYLGEHSKRPSATKRGPGRYHKGGKPGNRVAKERPMRAYVALMQAAAQKRVPNWQGPRDEHGAYVPIGGVYTVEGEGVRPSTREHVFGGVFCGPGVDEHTEYTARRKWLAGISAQRGY